MIFTGRRSVHTYAFKRACRANRRLTTKGKTSGAFVCEGLFSVHIFVAISLWFIHFMFHACISFRSFSLYSRRRVFCLHQCRSFSHFRRRFEKCAKRCRTRTYWSSCNNIFLNRMLIHISIFCAVSMRSHRRLVIAACNSNDVDGNKRNEFDY